MRWLTPPEHLIDEYLADGEVVLFNEAPDLRAWLMLQWPDFLVFIVVLVVMVLTSNPIGWVIGVIGEIVIVVELVCRRTMKRYTRYVLTDSRAIRMSGVIRRDHEWVAWKKITDVSVHRSVADRMFGTATIKIQSANEQSGFTAMDDVPNPIVFIDTIVEHVNATTGGGFGRYY